MHGSSPLLGQRSIAPGAPPASRADHAGASRRDAPSETRGSGSGCGPSKPARAAPVLTSLRPTLTPMFLAVLLGGCRSATSALPDPEPDHTAPEPAPPAAAPAAVRPRIGTDPGGASAGTPLTPRDGNELAAFAMGCFWGSED